MDSSKRGCLVAFGKRMMLTFTGPHFPSAEGSTKEDRSQVLKGDQNSLRQRLRGDRQLEAKSAH